MEPRPKVNKVIWTRRRVLVNTDLQRRCYNGAHFSSELQWTAWEVLDSLQDLRSGSTPESRLKFWRELNDYAVSQRGESARCEYELREELS
jgi:hypothetical protein